ncbi:hypothetical protein Tco_0646506 [Tanacetum coccineum]
MLLITRSTRSIIPRAATHLHRSPPSPPPNTAAAAATILPPHPAVTTPQPTPPSSSSPHPCRHHSRTTNTSITAPTPPPPHLQGRLVLLNKHQGCVGFAKHKRVRLVVLGPARVRWSKRVCWVHRIGCVGLAESTKEGALGLSECNKGAFGFHVRTNMVRLAFISAPRVHLILWTAALKGAFVCYGFNSKGAVFGS